MNVLVVADDPNLATLWGGVLKERGHDVSVADTETAALESLTAIPRDLVVLDLCVKGKSRLGLAVEVSRRNPSCRLIIVSGSAEYSDDAFHAVSPAVSAALRKPVDIEDLIDACDVLGSKERPATPITLKDSRGVELRKRQGSIGRIAHEAYRAKRELL